MTRVAIVHEWLQTYAGSERVLEQILALFPQAELFALVDFLPAEQRFFLAGRAVRTSFIQNLPFARKAFRNYLPLFPLAVEQFDLSGFDLVLSSSHAVAKGVITGPDQLHVSYIHSPMRYAWDMQSEYLKAKEFAGIRGWITRWMLHRLRQWDVVSSHGVDYFIANSSFIAERIAKFYRRDAVVVPPPVDTDFFSPDAMPRQDYYLAVGRQIAYKRIDLTVRAFAQMQERRLVVIGDGPEHGHLRAIATPNVTFLGAVTSAELLEHRRRARAEIFAGVEDFGIALVEAQAAGCPLIALARGGVLDIVRDLDAPTPTGVLFREQSAAAVAAAVLRFEREAQTVTKEACRENALRFSVTAFRDRYLAEIGNAIAAKGCSHSPVWKGPA